MQIRLDPPDLGTLHIRIDVRDGVMNATFLTANDEATHLLTHTLSQLKGALESQGVSVEKLQVQQTPKPRSGADHQPSFRDPYGGDTSQEQQRRQRLRRMWARAGQGGDPLDMVA